MRSILVMVLGASLVTAACSETPLSPTPVPAATTPAGTLNLRWDVVAAGCTPNPAPSPLPDAAAARVNLEGDGSIAASWSIVSPDNRAETLYAKFRPSGSDWALCAWDTVDQ